MVFSSATLTGCAYLVHPPRSASFVFSVDASLYTPATPSNFMEWSIKTVLESERYSCEPGPEPTRWSHVCSNTRDGLFLSFRLEENHVEFSVQGTTEPFFSESRDRRRVARHIDRLVASLHAAGFSSMDWPKDQENAVSSMASQD